MLFMDESKLCGSNDNEIDSLVKLVKIVPEDIGMHFGFEKCVVLKMKRGKQIHCECIDLGDGVTIKETDDEKCKCLGMLERDDIYQEKMKKKVQKEYYKRVRAVLKPRMNVANVINAINIWAAATVPLEEKIINWRKEEFD